jgi:hypothetical protein
VIGGVVLASGIWGPTPKAGTSNTVGVGILCCLALLLGLSSLVVLTITVCRASGVLRTESRLGSLRLRREFAVTGIYKLLDAKIGNASALRMELRDGTIETLTSPHYKFLHPQAELLNNFMHAVSDG